MCASACARERVYAFTYLLTFVETGFLCRVPAGPKRRFVCLSTADTEARMTMCGTEPQITLHSDLPAS